MLTFYSHKDKFLYLWYLIVDIVGVIIDNCKNLGVNVDKKEILYLAIIDIYKEFNMCVNHLNILREFLKDLLDNVDNESLKYDYPELFKKLS